MSDTTTTQTGVSQRTLTIALGAMLALVIGGLFAVNSRDSQAVAGANTVSAVSQVDNATLSENEARFILAVEDYDRFDYSASEESEIVLGGQVICSDLSNGWTVEEEASDMSYFAGIPMSDAVAAVQTAVEHLCPTVGSFSA